MASIWSRPQCVNIIVIFRYWGGGGGGGGTRTEMCHSLVCEYKGILHKTCNEI